MFAVRFWLLNVWLEMPFHSHNIWSMDERVKSASGWTDGWMEAQHHRLRSLLFIKKQLTDNCDCTGVPS